MTEIKNTYLIYGVSKGLGKAILKFLPDKNDKVFGISRTKPSYPEATENNNTWIQADLSKSQQAITTIKEVIGIEKIDYLIYNVGIWEKTGFTPNYNFEQLDDNEIEEIINTNITSSLLSIKSLLPNLKLSKNGKIIIIGSTLGLQNHNKKEIVFSVTKFAIRGIIHSLRTHLREHSIGVTAVNLGDLATEYEYEEGIDIVTEKHTGELIPLADAINALKFIISTSNATCVKEINMPSMKDLDI
ncbi:SDR family oxidoreductase [Chryseobacterium sp. S-02]|uniref:SDR family oxidoreductase n=1 Tax=Chryseobacterium sp. S-02 TaxID=3404064 RepID=UPI003CF49424